MWDARGFAPQLEAALPALLADAEAAIEIDSGSYHAAGVLAVQDQWTALLAGMGFAVQRQPLPGRGDQLTARLRLGEGRRLLLLGHADTVWPAGTVREWGFARRGNQLFGPGVGDMKTNVVMALHVLRLLLPAGLPGVGSVTLLGVPDEELGSPQSRAWIEAEARQADLCLTLEPARPGGGTVLGRGAVGAVYLQARGVTQHLATATAPGANAVAALAALVAEIEALSDYASGSTASVGILRGGAARQVVPDAAEMHVDLRAPDAAAATALLERLRAVALRPQQDARLVVEMSGGFTRPAFPTLPAMQALYERAAGFAGAIGATIFPVVSRGGSDGSFAAALGVPTLDGLGPVGHEICSRREWVELDSIVPRGTILAGLIATAGTAG